MKGNKSSTLFTLRKFCAGLTASVMTMSMAFGAVPATALASPEENVASDELEAVGDTYVIPGKWTVDNTTKYDTYYYHSEFTDDSLESKLIVCNTAGAEENRTDDTSFGLKDTFGEDETIIHTPSLKTLTNNGTVGSTGVITTTGGGGSVHALYTAPNRGTLTFYFKDPNNAKRFGVNEVDDISKVGDTDAKTKGVLGHFVCNDAVLEAGGTYTKADLESLGTLKVSKGNTPKLFKVEIPVKKNHTYIIALGGSKIEAGGITESLAKVMTGTIDLNGLTLPAGWGLRFICPADDAKSGDAVVDKDNNTFTVDLEYGDYSAVLTDANGYMVSEATTEITFNADNPTSELEVETVEEYTLSGNVTPKEELSKYGHMDDVQIYFVPENEISYKTVLAKYDEDKLSYSATLATTSKYTLSVNGAFDYENEELEIAKRSSKFETSDMTQDVVLNKRPVYDVTGQFLGLTQVRGEYETLDVTPTAISFADVDHEGYVYDGVAKDAGYSVKLKDGRYLTSITLKDYSTSTHVVVEGGEVERDLLLEDLKVKAETEYKETLNVGAEKEYKTVQAAVDAAKLMSRTSGQRVTIVVEPGIYREQVYIDTPDITIESSSGNKDDTKITWYYGIGYRYYSCVNSLYDPYADYDKFYRGDVISYWGSAVITTKNADGFKSRNITFENSFNKYMTEEEMNDGAEPNGIVDINIARKETTVVTNKVATERAAAFVNYADQTEFLNCGFIGSQDTLYTGDADCDVYFRNCYIEGNTDFIFGDGNVIFDGCKIYVFGYTDKANPVYLTANKASAEGQIGYVFRSCFIEFNEDNYIQEPYVDAENPDKSKYNYLGRMWGKYCTVAFLNTQLKQEHLLDGPGWYEMGKGSDRVQPTDDTVTLVEYNTTYATSKVDSNARVNGTVVSEIDLDKYSIKGVYTNGWTPSYAVSEDSEVPAITDGLSLSSVNGDLNAPNPGETVSVTYSFAGSNTGADASIIRWYAVKTTFNPETDTTVKAMIRKSSLLAVTSATQGRSFQIPTACAGKYIGVVVTPVSCYGKTGESQFVVNIGNVPVSETWIDPDNPGSIEPGSGINIYLAGDSTVKDYSAVGMYNSGVNTALGSWGEFLPYFFDGVHASVIDYAQGGRASRSFINEGKLDSIMKTIKKGDYLFIQFGHNDCANDTSNYLDRFVPLYTPATKATTVLGPNGKPTSGFPTIMPTDAMKTDGTFAWNCGATYKGFLQKYINGALTEGAIPVIVTPVARLYYNADGKIRSTNHHDATSTANSLTVDYTSEGNSYVTACKELYQENIAKGYNVMFMDAYAMTEKLYNDAYAECGSDVYGKAIMNNGESTHSNKVGGFIQAACVADWIKSSNSSLSPYVTLPEIVYGDDTTDTYIFTYENGVFNALDNAHAKQPYWTQVGQEKLNDLGTTKYPITLTVSGEGTVSSNVLMAAEGVKVTLSANAAEGYNFDKWKVKSGDVTITDNTFTMPASAVEIEGVFKKTGGGTVADEGEPVSILVGETQVLVPEISAAGTTEVIKWSVDKNHSKYVKVSNGVVTGKKATEKDSPAKVTAAVPSGSTWTVDVTVTDPLTLEELKVESSKTAKVSSTKLVKLECGPKSKDNKRSKVVTAKPAGKELKSGATMSYEIYDGEGNVSSDVIKVEVKDASKNKYTISVVENDDRSEEVPGLVYIKWTATKESVTASYVTRVQVTKPVSKVTVTRDGTEVDTSENVIEMYVGQVIKFDAEIDSTTNGGKIGWSAKGGCAKVTKTGYLTATKACKTGKEVTVTAKCGSIASTPVRIVVKETEKYAVLSKQQITLKRGNKAKTSKVTATVAKADKESQVQWEIGGDNEKVTIAPDSKKKNVAVVTVAADAEPGVYVISAWLDEEKVSQCEFVVK